MMKISGNNVSTNYMLNPYVIDFAKSGFKLHNKSLIIDIAQFSN